MSAHTNLIKILVELEKLYKAKTSGLSVYAGNQIKALRAIDNEAEFTKALVDMLFVLNGAYKATGSSWDSTETSAYANIKAVCEPLVADYLTDRDTNTFQREQIVKTIELAKKIADSPYLFALHSWANTLIHNLRKEDKDSARVFEYVKSYTSTFLMGTHDSLTLSAREILSDLVDVADNQTRVFKAKEAMLSGTAVMPTREIVPELAQEGPASGFEAIYRKADDREPAPRKRMIADTSEMETITPRSKVFTPPARTVTVHTDTPVSDSQLQAIKSALVALGNSVQEGKDSLKVGNFEVSKKSGTLEFKLNYSNLDAHLALVRAALSKAPSQVLYLGGAKPRASEDAELINKMYAGTPKVFVIPDKNLLDAIKAAADGGDTSCKAAMQVIDEGRAVLAAKKENTPPVDRRFNI